MVSEIKSIERAQHLLHCILKNFNFYIFHPILKLMHFFLQNHLSLWVTDWPSNFFCYFILNKIWPKFTNFAYLEGIYNFFTSFNFYAFFFLWIDSTEYFRLYVDIFLLYFVVSEINLTKRANKCRIPKFNFPIFEILIFLSYL